MTSNSYISENKTETLKKGDRVIMHTCDESTFEQYKDKVWVCKTDSYLSQSKQEVVFLENFTGCFLTEFLKKEI